VRCPNNTPYWIWTVEKEKKNTWWLPSSRALTKWNPLKKGPTRAGAKKNKKPTKSNQCKDFTIKKN